MIPMSKDMTNLTKNALFAMVDLFLDYAQGVDLYSQRDNITEFIIDLYNITEEDVEFAPLQVKFHEEFREIDYFADMSAEELTSVLQDTADKLFTNAEGDGLPPLIQQVIEEFGFSKK